MNSNEVMEIFLQALPELSEPLKSAVKFTLSNWHKLSRDTTSVDNLPHEIWRDVIGYENLYMVSNMRRVKSFYALGEKLLTPSANKSGYMYVVLTKDCIRKSCKVHTLVAKAFLPNPENKPVVHHRDCNRSNNHVENLEWATHQENTAYAVQKGSYSKKYGCDNPLSKLSADDVRFIRKYYIPRHREFGTNALSRKFNVSKNTILNVINHETYKAII